MAYIALLTAAVFFVYAAFRGAQAAVLAHRLIHHPQADEAPARVWVLMFTMLALVLASAGIIASYSAELAGLAVGRLGQ